MDNCLVLRVRQNNRIIFLPNESLNILRKFYSFSYQITLQLKYIGEGIFFVGARDHHKIDLEEMYQDKYVRDVLSSRKLQWIKEALKLNYFQLIYDDCIIVKNNVVEGQQSGRNSLSMKKPTSIGTSRIQTSPNIAANSRVSRVGDGETI